MMKCKNGLAKILQPLNVLCLIQVIYIYNNLLYLNCTKIYYFKEHLDALERGEMNESYDRRDSYYLEDDEEEEVVSQEMTSEEEEERISDMEEESDGDSRNDKDDSPYQLITFGLDDLANLNDICNDVSSC